MKPTRRMASIRTGCWCRGTAFPMSRKPFRLRSQSQPERIAEFPAGSSSISPAYITASFWLTPLSVYGALHGKHAGIIGGRRKRTGLMPFGLRDRRRGLRDGMHPYARRNAAHLFRCFGGKHGEGCGASFTDESAHRRRKYELRSRRALRIQRRGSFPLSVHADRGR